MKQVENQQKSYKEEHGEVYNGMVKDPDMEDTSIVDPNEKQMAQSRKAYYRELKKVIEASDVII